MIKNIFLCVQFFLWTICSIAQKKTISNHTYDKWQTINEDAKISYDGQYVMYSVRSNSANTNILYISTSSGRHIKKVQNATDFNFTSDSKYAFYMCDDSLYRLNLTTKNTKFYNKILSYRILECNKIIYHIKGNKELCIEDYQNKKDLRFNKVENYLLGRLRNNVIITSVTDKKNDTGTIVKWINSKSGKVELTWTGDSTINNMVLDNAEKQLVISISNKINGIKYWYFKKGGTNPILLLNEKSEEWNNKYKITKEGPFFSNNGKILTITLEESLSDSSLNSTPLHIWNYKSKFLESEVTEEQVKYKAAFNIAEGKLNLISDGDEYQIDNDRPNKWNDEWLSLEKKKAISIKTPLDKDSDERSSTNYSLSSTTSHFRKNMRRRFSVSPLGKYAVYYDDEAKQYYSFNINTDSVKCITCDISTIWTDNRRELVNPDQYTRGIAGWIENDRALLLYDNNDIWMVYLNENKSSICVTNEIGKREEIVFNLALREYNERTLKLDENLILLALNTQTKENGFYSKKLSQSTQPIKLTMGNFIYDLAENIPFVPGFKPIKASQKNVFVVRRMSASESPNYYSTKDFKTYVKLSNVEPESEYNWLTTELHSFQLSNGNYNQGILYKPSNFDPQKRYPVIFYYYEKLSNSLNNYIPPKISDGQLNIPWYVSNGYLVFSPDIKYTIGEPGKSAFNSVISAYEHLTKLPFVNENKIGIQGISMGGFETNYIITHTDKFAAACTSSGGSDFISYYGSLTTGPSKMGQFELGQYRIGATLWERPDLYIENSPVLNANNVKAPVLIMHTPKDEAVPFSQALEFFLALRRLGKRTWLLQYNDGNHAVWGKSAMDFTIRMQQFFDHYLKDAPPPKWMTAKQQNRLNKTDFFELDYSREIP